VLREMFPEKTDSVLEILVHLDRLRRAVQASFPRPAVSSARVSTTAPAEEDARVITVRRGWANHYAPLERHFQIRHIRRIQFKCLGRYSSTDTRSFVEAVST